MNNLKHFKILIILIIILMCHTISYADSMDNPVSTLDEFYTALGRQILDHKTRVSYYIASDELLETISGEKGWDSFEYHYNPDYPLYSGCYAGRQSFNGVISWFSTNKRTISVSFNYYVPKDTMDDYFEEMKKLADELKGENDYESVKNVHDYIINRVKYDHSTAGENYTDIEGFRENRMVCQGYSMATFVLLSYMDIPVRIVTGEAGTDTERGSHAWNIVQIDGKWYNYDATWDDSEEYGTHYTYFLKNNEDFPMHYPKGLYASPEFTSMISEESYSIPGSIINIKTIWIIVFISIIIIVTIKISGNNSYHNITDTN